MAQEKDLIRWSLLISLLVGLQLSLFAVIYLMPHGAPDWWGSEPTSTVHMVQDVGELAVRLGSPVRYHRAGNVVFMDSFEDGLAAWNIATDGTGADVYLTAFDAHTGAYGAKIIAGVDGSKMASLYHYEPYPGATVVGFEVAMGSPAYLELFEIRHAFVKDGYNLRARVRYDQATGDLHYYDALGSYQKFDTITPLYAGTRIYHPMKLTVDLEAGTYGRFYLDDDSWDLSEYELYSSPLAVSDLWGVYAHVEGTGGSNPWVIVDDLIMTQNEP